MTHDRYDLRFLRDAKIDRLGLIVAVAAYIVLLALTLLSVMGIIQPSVSFPMKGADLSDDELLAFLLVFGAIIAVVGGWAMLRRANQRKEVL